MIVPYLGCSVNNRTLFWEIALVLPHRLRQIREGKGFSQRELGRLCGLGANQINRYESGTSEPTVQTLITIANQLNASTDYLLGLTDDPQYIATLSQIEPDERELLDTYRHEGWSGVAKLSVDKLSDSST